MTIYYTYYSYEEFGRGYIGYRKCPEHLTPETDLYMGSYSDKKFKPTHKVILGTYDNRTDAIADEVVLHKAYDVAANSHFANRAKQTSVGFSVAEHLSAEHRAKISAASRGKIISAETRAKISEATRGRTHSAETKAKMSKTRRGKPHKPHTAEARAKISEAKLKNFECYDWENTQTGASHSNMSVVELNNVYPDLCNSHLHRVARGKYKHHKGWRVTLCHLVEPSLNRFKVLM